MTETPQSTQSHDNYKNPPRIDLGLIIFTLTLSVVSSSVVSFLWLNSTSNKNLKYLDKKITTLEKTLKTLTSNSQLSNSKSINTPTISPNITLTPINSNDSTTLDSWLVYKHPRASFQLRYPSNWILLKESEGCGPVFMPPENNIKNFSHNSWLTVCGVYLDSDSLIKFADRSIIGNNKLISRENIVIDNHPAIKQVIKNKQGYVTEILIDKVKDFQNRTGVLVVSIYNKEGRYPSKYQKTFEKIISTLKLNLDSN